MKSLYRIGTDILSIKKIKEAIHRQKDPFLARIFTENELAYCQKYKVPYPRYAGRFAAKEAVAKALGVGISKELTYLDMEILPNNAGKPILTLSEEVKKAFFVLSSQVSISHCTDYAVAFAMLELERERE